MNPREKELIFDEIQNQVTEPLLSAEKLSWFSQVTDTENCLHKFSDITM